jgi:hypothetical protein
VSVPIEEMLQVVDRALLWFDRLEAPLLRRDGLGWEDVDRYRRGFVQQACTSPDRVARILAWYVAGMPASWPARPLR